MYIKVHFNKFNFKGGIKGNKTLWERIFGCDRTTGMIV